ncbi:tetratricopeptide repeat protein [Segetibacter sp.]|jgi:tetratricopeptide (TPR) repeat protein|uniref:tetratricopeptide repeat protein n=1 Tax=Segetibacter sp. TaxID=2231182 RepID=UPI00262CBD1B|nr:tetratricopeptide repeat protein [Segetibacter sp.]MCW3081555.1 Tetratricopeptide 2 repeat-containing protein [Segetibacter sp.]
MADNLIQRAQILIQQNRYEEAGHLLRNILSQDPNNIFVLAMLSQVKLQQDDTKEAEELIDSAIGLSPDTAYLFYIKASIAIRKNKYDEAEKNLQTAVAIDPDEADFFALWASVKLTRKQYEKALELADEALQRDPENILGLNIRSTALLKLNRKEDSFSTIEGALAQDPNNAYTHSNYGWGLLEKGDHKKALEHFREALKNNPNSQHAQSGMAQALKAKYILYRLFLKYAFFMGNLSKKNQWGLIIGFYLATRLLNFIVESYKSLQPILIPFMVLIALFAFSTWIITPVSNLFLRLNPYGKYLLNKKEIWSSNFVGASLLLCIIGIILYSLFSNPNWLLVAVFGFAMMVPLGSMFSDSTRNSKLVIYSGVMFILGVLGIIQAFITSDPLNIFSILFLIGFVAFQWIANFMRIKQSNV